MAIVPLDKVTLVGAQSQKVGVLDGLQRLGCLHLVDLGGGAADEFVSAEAREALQFLQACPVKRRPATRRKDYDFAAIDAEALEIKSGKEKLEDERDHLQKAIAELKPWGDFRAPSADELRGQRLWHYVADRDDLSAWRQSGLVWQLISEDSESAYVAVIAETTPAETPGQLIELDPRPLSELKACLEDVEEELDALHWRRVSLTRWRKLLAADLDEADDVAARATASSRTLDQEQLFAIQAWAPRVAIADLRTFANENSLAIRVEPPAEDASPPTLLKNPERLAGGEGAVTFYITPDYHAWDPSIVVFFSFSLFFGMIVADAGYALVLGGLLLAMWRRMCSTRSGRRFRNLAASLVAATFVYGMLVGSYFGMGPPAPLAPLKIFDLQDKGSMMALAVLVGGLHLMLANVITARRLQRWGPAGWATVIAGGLLWGAGSMGPLPILVQMGAQVGLSEERLVAALQGCGSALMIVGAMAILLFSSDRPWRPLRLGNIAGRLFDGVKQVPNISKAFGDVLSYLRLFALALASAQLAATFNDLAAGAASRAGLGFLLAVLIIVVGHTLNLMLGIMSGVVHGLRLNCIEFFNWSLKEEGYTFQAFRKKADL